MLRIFLGNKIKKRQYRRKMNNNSAMFDVDCFGAASAVFVGTAIRIPVVLSQPIPFKFFVAAFCTQTTQCVLSKKLHRQNWNGYSRRLFCPRVQFAHRFPSVGVNRVPMCVGRRFAVIGAKSKRRYAEFKSPSDSAAGLARSHRMTNNHCFGRSQPLHANYLFPRLDWTSICFCSRIPLFPLRYLCVCGRPALIAKNPCRRRRQ